MFRLQMNVYKYNNNNKIELKINDNSKKKYTDRCHVYNIGKNNNKNGDTMKGVRRGSMW